MNWTLLVTKPAQKDLEKLPSRDQVRIERALDSLQIDPFSGDIKRLQARVVTEILRVPREPVGESECPGRRFSTNSENPHKRISPCHDLPIAPTLSQAADAQLQRS